MAFFQWSRRSVALDDHKFPTRNLEDNLQTAQHTRTGHLLPSLPSSVLPPPGTSAAGMHGHYGGRSRGYFIQHHMGPFGQCTSHNFFIPSLEFVSLPPWLPPARLPTNEQPSPSLRAPSMPPPRPSKCLNLNLGWMRERANGARPRKAPYFPVETAAATATRSGCLLCSGCECVLLLAGMAKGSRRC